MFANIWKSLLTGVVTDDGSRGATAMPERFRGRPDLDPDRCDGCGDCVEACPSRVIRTVPGSNDEVTLVTVDLAGCIFCGECVPACGAGAFRMTQELELASSSRDTLVMEAHLGEGEPPKTQAAPLRPPGPTLPVAPIGDVLRERIGELFGGSLHIREVSAGDCNACDLEVQATTNPIFDASRFGIHFVASPRHADMLLVTGPVSRNMAAALVEAYNACPEPKLVVAVGACAAAGGIFAESGQTMGGVDRVLPVNTYIPGCPPRPQAILHGILMTIERERPHLQKLVKRRSTPLQKASTPSRPT
ncbi:MAG: NADH-quinone oxidoreductase subunit NuoB [Candidatus Wallbacteria bacterium]|nr:NADH-quinone oxidoreductase subunit NuoB [Candidatus Wallbacteria bacterium]